MPEIPASLWRGWSSPGGGCDCSTGRKQKILTGKAASICWKILIHFDCCSWKKIGNTRIWPGFLNCLLTLSCRVSLDQSLASQVVVVAVVVDALENSKLLSSSMLWSLHQYLMVHRAGHFNNCVFIIWSHNILQSNYCISLNTTTPHPQFT
jgi:hypothetical protein